MKDKIINYFTDWRKVYGTWIVIVGTICFALMLFALIHLADIEFDANVSVILFFWGIPLYALILIMNILTPIAAIYLLIKKQWLDSLLLFLIYPIPFLMSYIGSKLSYFIF